MKLVEQAIFTLAETDREAGYRVVAAAAASVRRRRRTGRLGAVA